MEEKENRKSLYAHDLGELPATVRSEILYKKLLTADPLRGEGDPFGSVKNRTVMSGDLFADRSYYFSITEKLPETRLVPYPPMSLAGEVALIIRSKHGDEDATARLVLSNLNFVYSLALRKLLWLGKRIDREDMDDLAAEGIVGLLDSIERYDLKECVKLMTYAKWRVQEYIDRNSTLTDIRLPIYIQARIGIIGTTIAEYRQKFSKEPSLEDEEFYYALVSRILNDELESPEGKEVDITDLNVMQVYSQRIASISRFIENYMNGVYLIRDLYINTTGEAPEFVDAKMRSIVPLSPYEEWEPESETERRLDGEEIQKFKVEMRQFVLNHPGKRTLKNRLIFLDYMLTDKTQDEIARSANVTGTRVWQVIQECLHDYQPDLIRLGLWDDNNI